MKFFPFEKFTIESPQPAHDVIYRIRHNSEAKRFYRNPRTGVSSLGQF